LDPVHSNLESADHDTWYTEPTWPLNDVMNLPLLPSQSLTDLSKEAEAM